MSRLSVLSWLTSGFVHTLAFALLGTLLTQVVAERPDFFVPHGSTNVSFSPPPQQTAMVEVKRPLQDETVEFALPQPASIEAVVSPLEEQSESLHEAQFESPPVEEKPLEQPELLAMNDLALRPVELPRPPRTSLRRRPATPPVIARTRTTAHQRKQVETPVSQVVVERTVDREPEPQLKMADATPTQRQPRELNTPPVTNAEEVETEARQQQVAGSSQSQPPRAISNPSPEYPREAIRRRLEGTVKLRVQIGFDGRVLSVTVAQSSGYDMLDESALRAIRGWKFSPMLRDGKPAESSVLIPVRFHLD